MTVPQEEDLKHLSPEARLKRLRDLEEQRKKELEDTRKQVEEELAAAEALIQKTEEEVVEDNAIEEAKERLRETHFADENLEEKVAEQPAQTQNSEYHVGGDNLYQIAERAAQEFERLYATKQWTAEDQGLYNNLKEQVERAQSYNISSEKLAAELGLASDILNKMHYRT